MKHLSSHHAIGIRPRINQTGEEGFVILDALIAAALFGVFMMAVISMLVNTSHTNNRARDVTEASSLAAGVAEQLASLAYDDDDLQKNQVSIPDSEDGRFSFAVTTSLDTVVDNTMYITVTVSWVSQGRTRNVTINDIKVDYI
jgi:Tfp pilus assembly protein PilV